MTTTWLNEKGAVLRNVFERRYNAPDTKGNPIIVEPARVAACCNRSVDGWFPVGEWATWRDRTKGIEIAASPEPCRRR